jgi:electron transfer flavoprotein alpha subunit
VIVEPSATLVAAPHVINGRLAETHFTLTDADRSALETAVRLRDQAAAPVTIQVMAVGPREHSQALHEALNLGVDCVRLIVTDKDPVTPDSAALALAAVLADRGSFDLVLGGTVDARSQEGVVARLAAAALGFADAGSAAQIAVRKTAHKGELLLLNSADRQPRSRPLPGTVCVDAGLPLRPFGTEAYLAGAARTVEMEPWPKKVPALSQAYFAATDSADGRLTGEMQPHPLTPREAASHTLELMGLSVDLSGTAREFTGPIDDVQTPTLLDNGVVAILAADSSGRLPASARTTLRAAGMVTAFEASNLTVLLFVPNAEEKQRYAVAQALDCAPAGIVLLAGKNVDTSADLRCRLLKECWPQQQVPPQFVIGEPWTEDAFIALNAGSAQPGTAILRVRGLELVDEQLIAECRRLGDKLRLRRRIQPKAGKTVWIHLAGEVDLVGEPATTETAPRVERWSPRLEKLASRQEMQRLLDELKRETGITRLADADFIIDVGFGIGNRDGYETVIEPLEEALRGLGVKSLIVGGSRKVTEELHLLPADRQIGQSGVSVNPRIVLAIGISGAPQHINYIGARTSILAFNRDPDAPLMTLNQRQSRPKVYPVVGDLFATVPDFTAALRTEKPGELTFSEQMVK